MHNNIDQNIRAKFNDYSGRKGKKYKETFVLDITKLNDDRNTTRSTWVNSANNEHKHIVIIYFINRIYRKR